MNPISVNYYDYVKQETLHLVIFFHRLDDTWRRICSNIGLSTHFVLHKVNFFNIIKRLIKYWTIKSSYCSKKLKDNVWKD